MVAEDEQGAIVGLAIALPDYNQVFKRLNGRAFPDRLHQIPLVPQEDRRRTQPDFNGRSGLP